MGQAIGQVLALGVGVAVVPGPIIAVVLMLLTPRARVTGPAFMVGWLVGLGIVGAAVLLIESPTDAASDNGPATWVSVLKLLFGIALLLGAISQWRGRPRGDGEPATPKWMGAIEHFGPGKAAGAGAALGVLNPANLVLSVAAATTIAATEISGGQQAAAYAVFAVVGTAGVAIPVVIYFAMGDRAEPILERLRGWLARHGAVIVAVMLLLIGAKLIGDAISGFTS